jgi:hypothetical protein
LPSGPLHIRSPEIASAGRRPPDPPVWPAQQRFGRRSSDLWKPILLLGACLVAAAWVIQAPGKPALGLIGLLPILVVALAMNVFGLRSRLPLLGSREPIRAIGGWAIIGAVVLAGEFFALSGLGQASPAAHQASAASPPSAASAAAPPTSQAAAPPAPAPAPVSSSTAPAPAPPTSTAAKPAAPAANPALTLLAKVLTAIDPTLANDLDLRAQMDGNHACPRSSGDGGHMSLVSGAASGAAAMLQQCNHRGSR